MVSFSIYNSAQGMLPDPKDTDIPQMVMASATSPLPHNGVGPDESKELRSCMAVSEVFYTGLATC